MNRYLRIFLVILAAVFILMGIIGLFVPALQGILFLVIGIYILTLVSSRFKAWFDGHLLRFPRMKHHYDTHSSRVDKLFKKRGGDK